MLNFSTGSVQPSAATTPDASRRSSTPSRGARTPDAGCYSTTSEAHTPEAGRSSAPSGVRTPGSETRSPFDLEKQLARISMLTKSPGFQYTSRPMYQAGEPTAGGEEKTQGTEEANTQDMVRDGQAGF